MKSIFTYLLTLSLFLSAFYADASPLITDSTATLHVAGNCAMCKKRIETASLNNSHVKSAVWQAETQELVVSFNPAKTSLSAIKQAIAAVGHDVEDLRAKDEDYNKLHQCCLYPRIGDRKSPVLWRCLPTIL